MATSTLIPLSQYLGHSFHPDCDYIDGELQERNVGEEDHSELQAQILDLLRTQENKKLIRANPELRVQVKATRFRVPDICVRRKTSPREQIVRTPPLLCIEILSPEDTMVRLRERVRDYLDMGVLEVWMFDSESRTVTICRGSDMTERMSGLLTIPETSIALELSDLFKFLDEYD